MQNLRRDSVQFSQFSPVTNVTAACLFVSLFLCPLARAQGVRVLEDDTPLRKKPARKAKVIRKVAAETELELSWKGARKVKVSAQDSVRSAEAFGTVFYDESKMKLELLLPSRDNDDGIWIAVRTPEGKDAWVQREAVALTSGKRIQFRDPVPVIIPIKPDEVPTLVASDIPNMSDEILKGFERTYVTAHLLAIVNRSGAVTGAAMVRTSGKKSFDRVLQDIVKTFRFEPMQKNGEPAIVIVNLRFHFSTGSGATVLIQ